MKNRILIFVLTLSVTLGFVVAFAKTSKAYSQTEPIVILQITSQDSFNQSYSFENGLSTLELNQFMNNAFRGGANASWQFTAYITLFNDISVNDFYFLINSVDGLQELSFESNSGNVDSFNDNLSYVYNSKNLTIDSVKYVYVVATGTTLLDVVINIGNNGYNQGYSDGYNQGYNQGETNGYNQGYSQGEDSGYTNGYNQGYLEGNNQDGNSLYDMILAVVDTPFRIFDYIFDFDVLGINIKNIVLSFSTVAIAIFVIKRFI